MPKSKKGATPFARWVKSGGMTVAEVARTVHRPYSRVHSWYTGRCAAPTEFKIALELLSGGEVQVSDWGPL